MRQESPADARKGVFDPARDLARLPKSDRDAIDAASAKSQREGAAKIAELRAEAEKEAARLNAGMAGGTAKEKAAQYLDRSTHFAEDLIRDTGSVSMPGMDAARKRMMEAYKTLGVDLPKDVAEGEGVFRRKTFLDKVPEGSRSKVDEAAKANERAAILNQVSSKIGAAAGGPDALKRGYGNLPEPRITTMPDIADRVQVAALKSDDLKAELLTRQLATMVEGNNIAKEVLAELKIRKDAIKPYRMPWDQ